MKIILLIFGLFTSLAYVGTRIFIGAFSFITDFKLQKFVTLVGLILFVWTYFSYVPTHNMSFIMAGISLFVILPSPLAYLFFIGKGR